MRSMRNGLGAALVAACTSGVWAAGADDVSWNSYVAHIAAAKYALELNDGAAVRRWLDAAPAEHRNWEWRYLDAQSDSSLGVAALAGDVRSIAMAPDGGRAAACTGAGEVTVFELPGLTARLTFRAHEKETFCVRFSPDGARLITSSRDNTARIWDAATGKEVMVYKGHKYPVGAAA